MQGGLRKACSALASACRRSNINVVVTILIQPKPCRHCCALTEDREAERRTDGKGGCFITMPHNVLNTVNYLAALARATAT
jgi:hypothetical protein